MEQLYILEVGDKWFTYTNYEVLRKAWYDIHKNTGIQCRWERILPLDVPKG